MTGLVVTHRSTVTEDQIDHLGHMNVRFYGENARRGTNAVIAGLDVPSAVRLRLVDVYTRHHREQLLGTDLEVRSAVIGVDDVGLRIYHELVAPEADTLAACFVHRLVAETASGEPCPLPDVVADTASVDIASVPSHGASRTISLNGDPTLDAPDLDELRTRDLAMRRERSITADECDANGLMAWDHTPGLTWGGEPIRRRGHQPLHETAAGVRMGWASMETRMSVRRLPRRGDRIQSFGAALAVHDKTSHRIQWAYDVERGDLLASFEIVNLAFDIGARRAMSIPADLRRIEESFLHPDLGTPARPLGGRR